jgi:signal peptidase I
MPLWLVLVLYLALLVIVLAATPLFLWLGARWWRVPNVSFRRALAASACLIAINLVLGGVFIALQRLPLLNSNLAHTQGERAVAVVIVVLFMAVVIGAQVLLIKRILSAKLWRAGLVFLTELIASAGIGYGLAIGIRAVAFEAFIEPSNSMAPTILGNHSSLICANCAFSYAITQSDGPDRWPRDSMNAICPHCGFSNALAPSTPIFSGDRFLVDKLRAPQRWDCVVFWAPNPPNPPNTLYVKRLIGLPGETISLAGGHVFVDGKLVRRDLATASDLWRPTCDTRFTPSTAPAKTPHWAAAAESRWRNESTTWNCQAKDGDGDE